MSRLYLLILVSFLFPSLAYSNNRVNPIDNSSIRAPHTVLFEGFSNVSCQGCPELAANMEDFMHREGYGLDRVLYVMYSMMWPAINDPHYVFNPSENDGRMNYYLTDLLEGIPVLTMEGIKISGTSANLTPTADEIIAQVETILAVDPGFLIDVIADLSSTVIQVTVTITAHIDVALAGKSLVVELVQSPILYSEPPGSEGQTEFYYVFRDRADSVDPLQNLNSGQTQTINTNLIRGDLDLDTLGVVAFVQDDLNHAILQAGSMWQGQYPTSVDEPLPSAFLVHQNVPNPFNPSTTIQFSLPQNSHVSLRVYDVSGKLVSNLIDGQLMEAGHREKVWDGRDERGQTVSAGVYFYKLTAGEFNQVKSMVLVK